MWIIETREEHKHMWIIETREEHKHMWIIETREEHKHVWNTYTCGTQKRGTHKNTRVDRVQSYFNFETGITTGL